MSQTVGAAFSLRVMASSFSSSDSDEYDPFTNGPSLSPNVAASGHSGTAPTDANAPLMKVPSERQPSPSYDQKQCGMRKRSPTTVDPPFKAPPFKAPPFQAPPLSKALPQSQQPVIVVNPNVRDRLVGRSGRVGTEWVDTEWGGGVGNLLDTQFLLQDCTLLTLLVDRLNFELFPASFR